MIASRRHNPLWSITTVLFLALTLFACKSKGGKGEKEVEKVSDEPVVTALSASARPTAVAKTAIATLIDISATGGTGPYTVEGKSFASTTQISRTYTNTGTIPIVKPDSVVVTDSAGGSVTAAFNQVVYPSNMDPSSSGCVILSTPISPVEQTAVRFDLFILSGSGSSSLKAPYDFEFWPRQGNPGGPFIKNNYPGTEDSFVYNGYPSAGLYTAQLFVRDDSNHIVSCSLAVTARQPASVAVSASPSQVAAIGSTITLTATASNFGSSPITYSFRALDGAAQVQVTNNTAQVSVSDGRYHKFDVEVTATAGGETATRRINLTFTLLNYTCSLSRSPSGDVMTDAQVAVTVSSSTGAGVTVTSVSANGGGGYGVSVSNPALAKYSSSGTKTIVLRAEDTASGAKCNDGADLSISVPVRGAVQCTASVPSSGEADTNQTATATVISGTGTGSAVVIESMSSTTPEFSFQLSNPASLSGTFKFMNASLIPQPVTVTVRDSGDQRTAQCTAFHTPTKPCMVFQDLNGNAIGSIRAHSQFKLKIDNPEVYAAYTHINLGAASDPVPYYDYTWTNFPATTGPWRYTQNHASTVTGRVDYLNVGYCLRNIDITSALACSISARYLSLVSEISFARNNSPAERGTIDGGPYYGGRVYHQGNPASPVNPAQDSTVTAYNHLATDGNVAYRFNANNGSGFVDRSSASTAEAFGTEYIVHGAYPQDAIVSDANDPYQNSCRRSDDGNQSQVTNRVEVDGVQNIQWTRTWTNYRTDCFLSVTNNTGRSNVIYFSKNGATEQNLTLTSGAQTWIQVRGHGYWGSCNIKVRADAAYGEGSVNISNGDGTKSFALTLRVRHPWGTANYNLKPL